MTGFRESVQKIGKSAFAVWLAATGVAGAIASFVLEVLEHRGWAVWPWLPDVLLVVSVVAVVVAPLVAFHRLRLQFTADLTAAEAARDEAKAAKANAEVARSEAIVARNEAAAARSEAEAARSEAERRYRYLLGGGTEVGPGLRLFMERPSLPVHYNMDPISRSVFEKSRKLPTDLLVVVVYLLVDLEDARLYLWTDAPFHHVHGFAQDFDDDEARTYLLRPAQQRARWVELLSDAPLKAGQRLVVSVDSYQPVTLRRIALEPEPQPLDSPAETQQGPAG